MENKKIEELNIKLTVDTSELEDALQKFVKAGQVFNTVTEVTPFPTTELKEGVAKIQHVPQMPEEKKRLVKILMEILEITAERAAALGNDPDDIQSIYNLSGVIADLVK